MFVIGLMITLVIWMVRLTIMLVAAVVGAMSSRRDRTYG